MKQSAFNLIKDFFQERARIVRANAVHSFRIETAFWWNNWGNLISTTIYTIALIVFIKIIYSNVQTIAGYSYQEMLLFLLVGQLTFYTSWGLSTGNVRDLVVAVNRGDLDSVLTKPVPSLFFVSLKNINLVSTVRDGVPPTLALLLVMDWSAIFRLMSPTTVAVGFVIWVCGLFCIHTSQLLLALPAFKLGEAGELFSLSWTLDDFGRIPPEGLGKVFRVGLGILVPVVIASGFSASVILGKSEPYASLAIVACITGLFFWIRHRSWRWALKQYTSASS